MVYHLQKGENIALANDNLLGDLVVTTDWKANTPPLDINASAFFINRRQ